MPTSILTCKHRESWLWGDEWRCRGCDVVTGLEGSDEDVASDEEQFAALLEAPC